MRTATWTRRLAAVAIAAPLILTGCSGRAADDAASAGGSGPANAFSLSAAISGLNSSGLALSMDGNSEVVASGTTVQVLATSLASGTAYSVSIATQPAGETCSISSGSGTIGSTNASIVVTCSTQAYTLGGVVTGLTASGLLLANGGATLLVTSGSMNFEFSTPIALGSPYDVTVQTQPAGLTCSLTNSSGTMADGNVTNVMVDCAANADSVGGSIAGLNAAGLSLQDNGRDATRIDADAATFTMHSGVARGAPYAVTVQTQPRGLTCSVSNGAGVAAAADVTNVTVACLPNTSTLYAFADDPGEGLHPYGTLVQGKDGMLYGTTQGGGDNGRGTVFMFDPGSGATRVLHSFAGSPTDGAHPYASLVQDSRGELYGTTQTGGVDRDCRVGENCGIGLGTVFEIDATTGEEVTTYSFEGNADPFDDGEFSYAGLTLVGGNTLYGTTQKGGSGGNGTVFRVSPATDAETTLHDFAGGTRDGAAPYAGLILASDGNLYGTTQQGGANAAGTVFKINPDSGVESIVHSFGGGTTDGADPYGRLIEAKDGDLYGITVSGGANGDGTVFRIDPSLGVESVVYAFAGGSGDGASPYAGLLQASDGNLYGTTVSGGPDNDGTVFRVDPENRVESVVHAFTGRSGDGASPYGGLIQAADGPLYGTTSHGGDGDAGTLFRVTLR